MLSKINYIEIIKKLDAGGSATIYLGINTQTGFPVAVKELNPYLFRNPIVKKKFKEEANRYLELDHPNIVKLDDLILYTDRGYLVMEYIEGRNLRDHMRSITGPMPFQNVAILICEVLSALGYAHQRGVIHMDIKPSNIMLSNDDNIKLIDFGISQNAGVQTQEIIMGTPYYMSPEQIEGSAVDCRTDIYSVGITIFELISGKLPFSGISTQSELLDKIRSGKLPEVNSWNRIDKEMEKEMNEIIKKATNLDPDERFDDCEEFREALQAFL